MPRRGPHMFVGERSLALEMEQKPCTLATLLVFITHSPVRQRTISVLSLTLYGVTIYSDTQESYGKVSGAEYEFSDSKGQAYFGEKKAP